jgi:ABC-type multidrug transport system fused ATPase/permease subunit
MSERKVKSFLAAESRFQGRYQATVRDTIYQAYRPAFFPVLLFLAVGLLGRLIYLGNTNLIGYWVDTFCHGPRCRPVPAPLAQLGTSGFLWLLASATLLGFLLTFLFRVGVSHLSAEAVSRIYDETTLRTSRQPILFFEENPAGRVMTRFTSDYNNIFRIFGGPLAEFVALLFDLISMTVLITVASPWLLPFWLLQGLLNYSVYRWYLPDLRRERRESARRRSPAIAHFAESSAGAATIRAYQREEIFQRRFSALNDGYLVQREKTLGVIARFSFVMGSCNALTFLATGIASLWLVSRGIVSVGSVGVAFAYLGLSSVAMQAFFDWLGQFEEAMTGIERMNEYLRSPLEPGLRLPASAGFATGHPVQNTVWKKPALPVQAIPGVAVEVEDLWLRYREDLPAVLQGIQVTIAPGERLAVIGKTGSGKTSLVQALFRLYPIERGLIRIGGYCADLRENPRPDQPPGPGFIDLSAYRSLLAYITQEPTLFLGTLRENLFGPGAVAQKGGSEDEAAVEALRHVHFLHPEARKEEYHYWLDYPVEERGRNLSAGERQLVCMARCLIQNTPVVIFDEATSAVDPRSEEILTRATEEFFRGRTQIIIAHRLSTIRSCDRVLWLEKGKVRMLGPPGEVLPQFEAADLEI